MNYSDGLLQNTSDTLDSLWKDLGVHRKDVGETWILFCGLIEMLLPLALGMIKSGSLPSGGVIGALFQHLVDLSIGAVVWWMVGFNQAFSPTGSYMSTASTYMFNEVNAATYLPSYGLSLIGVTLFSSSVVCRLGIVRYALVTGVCGLYAFPVSLHWVWASAGWLNPMSSNRVLSGLYDVNGMAAAMAFAGGATLASVLSVPPRSLPGKISVFSPSGQLFVASHNKLYQSTGTLFLLMCFFALNSSGLGEAGFSPRSVAHCCTGTMLSIGVGALLSCCITQSFYCYLDIHHLLHCVLCGASMASTAVPYIPLSHVPFTTAIAVFLYYAVWWANGTYKLMDDPMRVVATYLLPAAWGVVATGLFSTQRVLSMTYPGQTGLEYGLLAGGSGELLASQLIGFLSIFSWGVVWSMSVLMLIKVTIGYDVYDHTEEWDVKIHHGNYCDYARTYFSTDMNVNENIDVSLVDDTITEPGLWKFLKSNVNAALRCSCVTSLLLVVMFIDGVGGESLATELTNMSPSIYELLNRTEELTAKIQLMSTDINIMWNLICGILVFSMQLGFCFLEAGCVRSGSVISIIFKNFADCALGGLCWWLCGYSIAYGGGSPFMGITRDRIAFSADNGLSESSGHFFLSFTYMTTAATIISGAVAERITLEAYFVIIFFVTIFAYPVVVHWVWSDSGWLSPWSTDSLNDGALDFSGSVVIHLFGGTNALTLAALIGPRKLRDNISVFSPEGGEIVAPHNKFQLATGTLLLWTAWFAFNGGSVVSFSGGGGKVAANAIISTLVASATSGIVGMFATRILYGYFELTHCCNTVLVGLVSITASCAYVSPVYAPIIGAVAVVFYFVILNLVFLAKIDDVVDAGAVHFGGGLWGGLAVGLFSDEARVRAALATTGSVRYGLFHGGGGTLLSTQCVAILVVVAWAVLLSFAIYFSMRLVLDVRTSEEAELQGLDLAKHKAHSYDYIDKLEAEKTRAVESVEVAHKIAEALVSFNLDAATKHLNTSSGSSSDLYMAYYRLIENLQMYRPYLPDSLFEMQTAKTLVSPKNVPAPGDSGSAAIVFTDIEQSTASWEECPEGMNKGLKIHNTVLRECISEHNGYEVKTIGDAFMVAFESVVDACKFGLDAHVVLYKAHWPSELLDVDACSQVVEEQWCGPRIRIGIHWGAVEKELNRVTGRYDYFGGTVNRAARVEAACVGGAVAVTRDVLDCIKQVSTEPSNMDSSILDSGLACLNSPHVLSMGEVALKGAGAATIHIMIPQEVIKRREHIETCIKIKAQKRPTRMRAHSRDGSTEEKRASCAGSGFTTSSDSVQETPEFLREKLERVAASTIACVCVTSATVDETVHGVNDTLTRVIACAERTEGVVVGMLSSSILVGWNTSKRISSHFETSLRCVSLLDHIFKRADHNGKTLSVGLSTGSTLCGNLGSSAQRFVAVNGLCVPMAVNLSESCRALCTTCLFCTPMPDDSEKNLPLLHSFARPVDKWYLVTSSGPKATVVYEVNTAGLKDSRLVRIGLDEEVVKISWEWSTAYWEAFQTGHYAPIEAEACSSATINRIVNMLKTNSSLRYPMFLV